MNKLAPQQIIELRESIKDLKENQLPLAKKRLAIASAQGDLSENDEFDSAKKEIALIMQNIRVKEETLNDAIPLTVEELYSTQCREGNTISLIIDGKEYNNLIIGKSSGDDFMSKISPDSILGTELIGREIFDEFMYKDTRGILHNVVIKEVS